MLYNWFAATAVTLLLLREYHNNPFYLVMMSAISALFFEC